MSKSVSDLIGLFEGPLSRSISRYLDENPIDMTMSVQDLSRNFNISPASPSLLFHMRGTRRKVRESGFYEGEDMDDVIRQYRFLVEHSDTELDSNSESERASSKKALSECTPDNAMIKKDFQNNSPRFPRNRHHSAHPSINTSKSKPFSKTNRLRRPSKVYKPSNRRRKQSRRSTISSNILRSRVGSNGSSNLIVPPSTTQSRRNSQNILLSSPIINIIPSLTEVKESSTNIPEDDVFTLKPPTVTVDKAYDVFSLFTNRK